jgi:hypothetical protein
VREPRRDDPLIDPRFFRSAPFSGATATAVTAFAAMGGFLFLNTLYLQDVRGFGPLAAGLWLLPMAGDDGGLRAAGRADRRRPGGPDPAGGRRPARTGRRRATRQKRCDGAVTAPGARRRSL